MKGEVAILVSCAGRRVALIECLRDGAASLGLQARIIAIDAQPELSAACQVADEWHRAPPIASGELGGFVQQLAATRSIRLIVPTIDTELATYSAVTERLRSKGVHVNISSEAFVRIARDKELTARELSAAGVPVPSTIGLSKFLADPPNWRFPLLAKPRDGSSSIGIHKLHGAGDAAALANDADRYLVQEWLSGVEYTVNAFVDQHGKLACVVPHRRIEVRAGEVSKGRTERLAVLEEIAATMFERLPPARGALCFQSIVTPDGAARVFEINARFGGGYPLAHRAGAKFTQWLLEETLDLAPTAGNEWQAGLTMLRYDSAVFRREPTP